MATLGPGMDDQQINPYATPSAALLDPDADVPDALELAERMTRLGASLIDSAFALVVVGPVMYFSGFWARAMAQQVGLAESAAWTIGGFAFFVALQGYPLHQSGQTWGKRMLGIRIVDLEGRKPGLGRLIGLRYAPLHFVAQIPIFGQLVGLINPLVIFRSDRRCLHDHVAGTRVVKVKSEPRATS